MCSFDKTTLEMPALIISCLLQSVSLNELLNQVSFSHKIEISLFVRNPLQELLKSHQVTEMGGEESENTRQK